MRRSSVSSLVLLTALAFGGFLPTARAQSSGALSAIVRTAEGAPVPQVVLRVAGPSGQRNIVTGPDGRFHLAGLQPGDYTLALEVPGFVLGPKSGASVEANHEATLELTLRPGAVREHVVVAATRGEAVTSTLGTTVSVLDRAQIDDHEPTSLLNLFQEIPGLNVARAGGIGAQATLFLRGGASNFARVLVDGVPVNEPGGAWNYGPLMPFELERIEVVKGAASSLYSTDALAGVISLATRRAAPGEGPSVNVEAEGGSFDWQRYAGGTSGRAGGMDWNLGLVHLETDNEQPNSAFRETTGALSAGTALGERGSLRLLVRAEDSRLGTPGQTAYGRPDLDASFDESAVVAGLSFRSAGPRVAHEARASFSRSNQLSRDPLDSGAYIPTAGDKVGPSTSDFTDPLGFQDNTDRWSFGYQAAIQASGRDLVTAGVDLERESGELGSVSDSLLSPTRTNVGAYVQDRMVLGRLYATVGGRVEHNESFGTKVVPRVALAFRARGGEDATTLRASAGAGIKEPDFFQSFGTSSFALGNPDLKPERSRTFDIGAEQRLFHGRARADATFFDHDYRDQIAYEFDFVTSRGTYVNLGQTRGRGLELALAASPLPKLALGAEYTYLEGKILVSSSAFDPTLAAGQPLQRRPKHQGSFSARVGDDRYSASASVVYVGERADSDFEGIGIDRNGSYTRVDARVHARLWRGLSGFLVAENLFDRQYQEVLGYPALGRSVRVGLRYQSGTAAQ